MRSTLPMFIDTEAFRPRDLIVRTPIRSSTPRKEEDTSVLVAETDASRGSCDEKSIPQKSLIHLQREAASSGSSPCDDGSSGVGRNSSDIAGGSGSFDESEGSQVGRDKGDSAGLGMVSNVEEESQPRSLASKNLASSRLTDMPVAPPSFSGLGKIS